MTIRLSWVDRKSVDYACRHWHYARATPAGRLMALGVFESDRFIGTIVFGRGATPKIGIPYGLEQGAVCELVRVALRDHVTPVSKMLAVALRLLKRRCPGLRLVVSYAAGEEGHYGGIYQATNWIYEGPIDSYKIELKGKLVHARSIGSKYGRHDLAYLREAIDPNARPVRGLIRHKYLMPLDDEMRAKIAPLHKAYPKPMRAKQATTGDHPGGGGAEPTRALHFEADSGQNADRETGNG